MGVLLILKLLPGVEHLQFHLLAPVHGTLILFDPLFILVLYLLLLFLPGYLHLLITNPYQILLGFFRLLLQFLKLLGQISHLNRMFLALVDLLVLKNQQFFFPLDSHKFLGLFNLLLQFFVVSVGYCLIFIFFPDQLILFTFNFTTQFLYLRCVFIWYDYDLLSTDLPVLFQLPFYFLDIFLALLQIGWQSLLDFFIFFVFQLELFIPIFEFIHIFLAFGHPLLVFRNLLGRLLLQSLLLLPELNFQIFLDLLELVVPSTDEIVLYLLLVPLRLLHESVGLLVLVFELLPFDSLPLKLTLEVSLPGCILFDGRLVW